MWWKDFQSLILDSCLYSVGQEINQLQQQLETEAPACVTKPLRTLDTRSSSCLYCGRVCASISCRYTDDEYVLLVFGRIRKIKKGEDSLVCLLLCTL